MPRNTFGRRLTEILLYSGILVGLAAPPAHAGTLEWVRQFEGVATGVSTDGPGNIYVVDSVNGPPEPYGFLRKYDSAGNVQWARQTGSAPAYRVEGVSPDGLGNVYISGWSVAFVGHVSAPADAFVSKYDGAGDLEWTRQLETDEVAVSNGVSADGLGNVYIAGLTSGSIGGPNAGGRDAFVSKYDASGNFQWTKQLGTSADDASWGVSADKMGNVYISGYLGSDAFVSKYDGAGNLQWTRQLETDEGAVSFGVLADGLGNVYITGYIAAPPAQDAFLAKYDTTGAHQWTRQLGTANAFTYEQSWDITADGLGNVYIAGSTGGSLGGPNKGRADVFVSKYDTAGNYHWTFQFGTTTDDFAYGVSADGLGNLYIAGNAFLAKYVIPEPGGWQLAALAGAAVLWISKRRKEGARELTGRLR